MAYGFELYSGTGTLVESASADTPQGLFVDSFNFQASFNFQGSGATPVVKSYPNFTGTTLLPVVYGPWYVGVTIDVDNPNKTITFTPVRTLTPQPVLYVVVLGT